MSVSSSLFDLLKCFTNSCKRSSWMRQTRHQDARAYSQLPKTSNESQAIGNSSKNATVASQYPISYQFVVESGLLRLHVQPDDLTRLSRELVCNARLFVPDHV